MRRAISKTENIGLWEVSYIRDEKQQGLLNIVFQFVFSHIKKKKNSNVGNPRLVELVA